MGNTTFLKLFFSKDFKKIQHLAFTEKVKTIKCFLPEKVKIFIKNTLYEELKYFEKKYSYKIEVLSENNLIIPEYRIQLLNKSKKIINKFEI